MTVREFAEWLGATFEGDGEKEIAGVASVESAGAAEISFVVGKKAAQLAAQSAAGCLIAPPDFANPDGRTLIRSADPRGAVARVVYRLHPRTEPVPGIHPTATIAPGVELGANVAIGPRASVAEGAKIGAGRQIDSRETGGRTMSQCSAGFLWVLPLVLATPLALTAQQSKTFNFDSDAVGKAPARFSSYATGGGPAGKWLVTEMSGAPSGRHVVVQTDADPTDTRFPVLIADNGEYVDLDVSMKAKSISGKVDQGMGLVFRFRDPQSHYIVRANALEDNFRLCRMVNGKRLQCACPLD